MLPSSLISLIFFSWKFLICWLYKRDNGFFKSFNKYFIICVWLCQHSIEEKNIYIFCWALILFSCALCADFLMTWGDFVEKKCNYSTIDMLNTWHARVINKIIGRNLYFIFKNFNFFSLVRLSKKFQGKNLFPFLKISFNKKKRKKKHKKIERDEKKA